jgi:hypothetical protein
MFREWKIHEFQNILIFARRVTAIKSFFVTVYF